MQQIPLQTFGTLLDIPVNDVELVEPPFVVGPLLAGKVKVPLAAIRQDRHRHAVVVGVFEQLTLRSVALANLLDLNEGDRLAWQAAQGEVDTPAAQRVFRPDRVGVVGGPAQCMEKTQDDALRDRCLIGEAAGLDAKPDCFDLLFDAHGERSATCIVRMLQEGPRLPIANREPSAALLKIQTVFILPGCKHRTFVQK